MTHTSFWQSGPPNIFAHMTPYDVINDGTRLLKGLATGLLVSVISEVTGLKSILGPEDSLKMTLMLASVVGIFSEPVFTEKFIQGQIRPDLHLVKSSDKKFALPDSDSEDDEDYEDYEEQTKSL